MKTTLGVAGTIAGAAITGAALLGASPQRAAEPARMSVTDFPFATLRTTQKLHLNIANVVADAPDTKPPCRAVFRLFDSNGEVVSTAESLVASGTTAQIVHDPPDTIPGRIQGVRGELLVTEGRCNNSVIGSMEIVDTTSGEVRAVIAPTKSNRVTDVVADAPDTTPPVS